jgi:adenylylsulfate kinase-like enzyme
LECAGQEPIKVGLRNFTGIDSLYEAPQVPDIHVAGLDETPEATAARIADWSVAHQGRTP